MKTLVARSITLSRSFRIFPSRAVAMLGIAIGLNLQASESSGDVHKLPENLPTEILVKSGALEVRFDQPKAWTLSRVDFQGNRLGIDAPGTSYGTVIKFSEKGFVGTGHITEEYAEKVEFLFVEVDGVEVKDWSQKEFSAEDFFIEKRSRIEGFVLQNSWRIVNDQIYEKVQLLATEDLEIDLAYVFMMAWDRSMTDFIALGKTGEEILGEFEGQNRFRVMAPTHWVAIYNRELKTGVVTRILEATDSAKGFTRLWDKASPYKKHYHQILRGQKVASGAKYEFEAVTGFFEAEPGEWQEQARNLADSLSAAPVKNE